MKHRTHSSKLHACRQDYAQAASAEPRCLARRCLRRWRIVTIKQSHLHPDSCTTPECRCPEQLLQPALQPQAHMLSAAQLVNPICLLAHMKVGPKLRIDSSKYLANPRARSLRLASGCNKEGSKAASQHTVIVSSVWFVRRARLPPLANVLDQAQNAVLREGSAKRLIPFWTRRSHMASHTMPGPPVTAQLGLLWVSLPGSR